MASEDDVLVSCETENETIESDCDRWLLLSPDTADDATENECFYEPGLHDNASLGESTESEICSKNKVGQMSLKDTSEKVKPSYREVPETIVAIENIETVDESEEVSTIFEANTKDETPKSILVETESFDEAEVYVSLEALTANSTMEVESDREGWLRLSPETSQPIERGMVDQNLAQLPRDSPEKVTEERVGKDKNFVCDLPEVYVVIEKINVEEILAKTDPVDEDELPLLSFVNNKKPLLSFINNETRNTFPCEHLSAETDCFIRKRTRKSLARSPKVGRTGKANETPGKRVLRSSCGSPIKSYKMESDADDEEEWEHNASETPVKRRRMKRPSDRSRQQRAEVRAKLKETPKKASEKLGASISKQSERNRIGNETPQQCKQGRPDSVDGRSKQSGKEERSEDEPVKRITRSRAKS